METGIGARRPNLSAEKQARFKQQLRVASTALKEPPRTPRRLESGRAPLSFAQQLLWFFSQLEPNSPPYNLPTALRLCDRLDRDALERALTADVARPLCGRGWKPVASYRRACAGGISGP